MLENQKTTTPFYKKNKRHHPRTILFIDLNAISKYQRKNIRCLNALFAFKIMLENYQYQLQIQPWQPSLLIDGVNGHMINKTYVIMCAEDLPKPRVTRDLNNKKI